MANRWIHTQRFFLSWCILQVAAEARSLERILSLPCGWQGPSTEVFTCFLPGCSWGGSQIRRGNIYLQAPKQGSGYSRCYLHCCAMIRTWGARPEQWIAYLRDCYRLRCTCHLILWWSASSLPPTLGWGLLEERNRVVFSPEHSSSHWRALNVWLRSVEFYSPTLLHPHGLCFYFHFSISLNIFYAISFPLFTVISRVPHAKSSSKRL